MKMFCWMKTVTTLAVAVVAMAQVPVACHAGLTRIYYDSQTSGADAAYENQGGWLQKTYNLPNIVQPDGTTSNTVLPQVERTVAQLALNNANGLHVPNGSTGIPGQSYSIAGGGTGTGVHSALTNSSPIGNDGGAFQDFVRGTDKTVTFELKRTGNVVSYKVDGRTWTSSSEDYFGDGNALQFRIRSVSNVSLKYSDLVYSDSKTNKQSIDEIDSEKPNVTIALFDGVEGDFRLTGKFIYDATSGLGSTGWNTQIKLLSLGGGLGPTPPVVPEPASMAIFGLLGGTLGWSRWRQRKNRS
ncbi:MAG: PEP-CTERM sorting domain-containing protein [Pirellula sp.]